MQSLCYSQKFAAAILLCRALSPLPNAFFVLHLLQSALSYQAATNDAGIYHALVTGIVLVVFVGWFDGHCVTPQVYRNQACCFSTAKQSVCCSLGRWSQHADCVQPCSLTVSKQCLLEWCSRRLCLHSWSDQFVLSLDFNLAPKHCCQSSCGPATRRQAVGHSHCNDHAVPLQQRADSMSILTSALVGNLSNVHAVDNANMAD